MLTTIVAVSGLGVAIVAIGISVWVALVSKRDMIVNASSLTLSAYSAAIQGGILNLKGAFTDRPEIFTQQVQLNPDIEQLIPDYMRSDIPAFLAFAGGMWRLSYVHSVISRHDELGLRPEEYFGLKREMKLWLTDVPGFYDVYRTHTSQLGVHNLDFLNYLRTEVYTAEFRALADTEREFGPAHPRTIAARRNLASWYESTGRLAKAISLYNRALVDSERTPGADDAEAQKLREIVAALKIKQQASTIARLGPSVLQGRSSGSLRVRLRLPQWPAHHQSSDDKL